jgi:protein-S-isoprenylcysteine O-methyltransferase Ste14
MPVPALVLYGISLAIAFGLRVALQLRRTGSTGLHGLPPGAGPVEWIAGGLFIAGLVMGGAAPVLALLGILEPIPALDGLVGYAVGLVFAVSGIALTFGAQLAMGDSWRVGVDPEERTDLVTEGPFRLVRNPIYSAMLPTVLGLVLMVPNALAVAAIVTLFVGLELQVRLVEEPYLLCVHGDTYAAYASRVGRFVPRLGLLHGALGQALAIWLLGAVVALALLAPAEATALDSDLKGFAVFKLEASHGYSILGFASSERIDGRGSIGLIVYRKGAAVSYAAPATVTPTRLEAGLGPLGQISAEMVPRGKKETLRSRCSGNHVHEFERRVYRGTFEFHGEEGYTNAVAAEVPEDAEFLLDVLCRGAGGGEVWGPGLPGARLRAFSRHGDRHLSLQLNKNRPGKATIFSATLAERRGEIHIDRSVYGRQPARAFEYAPLLGTATVAPAAPFSGAASFSRRAGTDRWTGNLSLDFPGERHVPLTGAGFSLHLVHARRS